MWPWRVLFKAVDESGVPPVPENDGENDQEETHVRKSGGGTPLAGKTSRTTSETSTPITVAIDHTGPSHPPSERNYDGIEEAKYEPHWNPAVFGEDGRHKDKFLPKLDEYESIEAMDDYDHDENQSGRFKVIQNAKWQRILAQSTIPLTLAGCSLIIAGYMLQLMRKTAPFVKLRELTVMVTPLLGLKSQLELTSVARFTMHLNLGHISKADRVNYCIADIALSMAQTVLAALCSGYFAVLLVWLREERNIRQGNSEIWTILAASCGAASMTCLITTVTTMMATLLCFKYHVDPNNVAVPIVACIGDITTLGTIDLIARLLYSHQDMDWLAPFITVSIILLAPMWCVIAYRNPFTRSSLWACWFPTMTSVAISCAAGMLLEFDGEEYDQMELYQPLITGVGGTIVAIHYCRIATSYISSCQPGTLPKTWDGKHGSVCIFPCSIFIPKKVHTPTYVILLGIIIPAQALFSLLIYAFLMPAESKACYALFLLFYVISCFIQSTILLYLSHVLFNFLWKLRVDAGFYVIPCMHSLGDIIGTLLLLVCCHIYKIQACKIT